MSSTTSPSLTGSAAASASASATASTSSSPSSSPPIFVGFIGVGVLILCLTSLCMWRRLIGRNISFATSTYDPNARWPQHDHDPANGRPEMFDAWMGERASEGLKWEQSMPFSVTILTDTESHRTSDAVRKRRSGKHPSNSAMEREREKQDSRSSGSGVQVAVLVTMPSPLHTQSHDGVGQEASGSSLRDELAIGLIEFPWIKEDRHSLKRNTS